MGIRQHVATGLAGVPASGARFVERPGLEDSGLAGRAGSSDVHAIRLVNDRGAMLGLGVLQFLRPTTKGSARLLTCFLKLEV